LNWWGGDWGGGGGGWRLELPVAAERPDGKTNIICWNSFKREELLNLWEKKKTSSQKGREAKKDAANLGQSSTLQRLPGELTSRRGGGVNKGKKKVSDQGLGTDWRTKTPINSTGGRIWLYSLEEGRSKGDEATSIGGKRLVSEKKKSLVGVYLKENWQIGSKGKVRQDPNSNASIYT